jgi:LAGLIDADG endonuclease
MDTCRPWLYAGNPLSLPLLVQSFNTKINTFSISDNAVGLGNQQGSSNNLVDNCVSDSNNLVMPTSNQNKSPLAKVSSNNAECNDSLGYWIAGFFEGEGSFNVAFKLKSDLRMGIQVSPEISVTQHASGKQVLELIKKTFGGIGSGILLKDRSNKGNNVLVYKVTSLKELLNTVIPFLQKYNIYSARTAEFNMLVAVCGMLQKKEHLTVAGMIKIINLVYDTPLKKSNRQFKKHDLLNVLGDQSKVADMVLARRQVKLDKANNQQ